MIYVVIGVIAVAVFWLLHIVMQDIFDDSTICSSCREVVWEDYNGDWHHELHPILDEVHTIVPKRIK